MLRQLPSKTEVDNLLVDISQTGLAAALDQKLFQPETEIKKDFYAERPIKIRFAGSYHQFGAFVSGIAALPRIVTLHDVQITPANKSRRRRFRPAADGPDGQDLSLPRRRGSGGGRRGPAQGGQKAQAAHGLMA